jgi:RNA polymerase subunit RPABC4/transcription elongation factor Spt4
MTEIQKACKKCMIISTGDTCPICGDKLSKKWQGYFILMDCTTSIIGERIGYKCDPKVIAAIGAGTADEAFAKLGVEKAKLTAPDEVAREEELRKIRQMVKCSNHCDALVPKLDGIVKRGQIAGSWRYALRVR